jgi:hypothetical protein
MTGFGSLSIEVFLAWFKLPETKVTLRRASRGHYSRVFNWLVSGYRGQVLHYFEPCRFFLFMTLFRLPKQRGVVCPQQRTFAACFRVYSIL